MQFKKVKSISIQGWGASVLVVNWVSPCHSFFFSASTVPAYIFTVPTCKATLISLEPCALNADFQHFIPRFNKISYFMDTPERRVWDERRPKDRLSLQIILVFILTCRKPFTWACVSVFDKCLHWPRVSEKIYIHCNMTSVNVKHLDV